MLTRPHTGSSGESERCRICGGNAQFAFMGPLLNYSVRYFDCDVCGYLQTEWPFWLDEAYASPINISDTGLVERNITNAKRVATIMWRHGFSNGRVVDFAGGHGLLVRMLRDIGIDAYWDDKYCQNSFARGFEHDGSAADFITAFEAFEHFVEPTQEIDRFMAIAPNVVFSTLLLPDPVPEPGSWWYYGPDHGQHIGFYRKRTLEWLAKKHSALVSTDGASFHVISKSQIRVDLTGLPLKLTLKTWPLIRRLCFKPLTWSDHLKMKTPAPAGELRA